MRDVNYETLWSKFTSIHQEWMRMDDLFYFFIANIANIAILRLQFLVIQVIVECSRRRILVNWMHFCSSRCSPLIPVASSIATYNEDL